MGYALATPKSTTIGTPVAVLSSASHDVAGTPIAYHWSVTPAAAGSFANADTANTSFNCATASTMGTPHRLTLTATAAGCSDTLSVPLSCANLLCGNGAVDPGETCDDAGAPGGCPNDCTQLCGDGEQEGTEQCDPPNGTTCSATCTTIAVECGNGIVQPGETCEPPNTATCDATCHTIGAVCGNGIVQGTEECDPGATPTAGCSNDCNLVASAACLTCEAGGNCAEIQDACNFAADALPGDPNARAKCYDVLECMFDTKCAQTSPVACFCGAVDTASCSALPAGGATGPCHTQIEAALGSNVPLTVLGNFSELTLPGGWANQRAFCQNGFCNAACLQ
jgi:hypothetical protein